MKIVDTRGQSCPAPLIATKRAITETGMEEAFQVLIGSQNALNNISRFLKDNKAGFSVTESEGFWTMTVSKKGEVK
jgi:tRNA 2-thiouridine synthesizing protein A